MSTTSDAVAVEVPDIGDFEDVPIIEILVSPGDTVAVDDPLLTLESDKATMDVPAPFAGTVRELRVNIGDKVSQGVELMTLSPSSNGDSGGGASAAGPAPSTGEKAAGSVESATHAEEEAAPAAPPEQPERAPAPEAPAATPAAPPAAG
ncbi:MAG: hypothetical protein JO304_06145, partial [Solirubrobacterales bacterium]|nr:hypothetical protein [Solirubrobacterales bacterium]